MAENYILFLSSVFLLFGLILTQEFAGSPKYKMPEVCRGSSEGLSASGKDENRYLKLKKIYENCTYVDGNLEIKFLEGSSKNYDLSFLSHIEEVSGYVIIASLHTKYIPLPNLKIIRGNKLFHYKGGYYSLFVALNHRQGTTDVGLHELQLTSLAEITRGDVYFSGNDLLCFHDTVLWKDIKFDPKYKVKISSNNTQTERRKCGECDEKCLSTYDNNRHCWGKGPDMCQKFTRVTCHAGCDAGCFGPAPSQCCHPQCAAGCTGPRSTDCVVCKNFYNEGKCVSECPKPFEYNRQSMRIEENPEGKYSYGSTCVKECPEHMSKDTVNFHCVYSCPDDYHSVNGTCVKCDRQCPKRCRGHDTKSVGRQYLTSKNIHEFENCTVVDGNLMIVEASFNGDSYRNISGITFDQLNILKSVIEIKGHLGIQSNHPKMKDLSFLSNLEVIHGRELDVGGNAFTVIVTLARSLEMISLKKVENGKISIWGNKNLCFLKGTNFSRLLKTTGQKVELTKNKDYRDCQREGEVCDPSCSNDGCWGKGPNKCLECRTYRIDNSSNICIESCDAVPLLYDAGGRRCRFCHTECVSACTGPEPRDCDKCRNYMVYSTKVEKDGSRNRTCLRQCPDDYYSDSRKVCYPCHNDCKNGCTGPSNVVGKGGCNTCELGIERKDAFGNSTYTCSPFADQDGVRCPNTHFEIRVGVNVKNNPLRGESACLLCHELCDGCIQDGPSNCKKCRYVNQDGICLKQCYSLSYSDENNICRPCHKECLGECHGATNGDCKACKNFKIYLNADMGDHLLSGNCSGNGCQLFNCTEECPSTMTYRVKDYMSAEEGHTVCADESHPEVQKMIEDKDEANKQKIIIIICSCLGGIVVLAAALTLFGYLWRQRARSQEKTAILTAKMTGYDDEQPVTPTDAKPDMSNLRLIKESELRRGGIIGSGAFGTVYKGFWIPNNENVKIPVAIKVLQEGTSPNQNKELLEEARVMASVEHMCCIRILAVCMTAQMMLITQLMPLGCLLDYVRKHKDNIGSKVLLNWCTQIAKGMAYLEERGIVHRDLAARNVLVQSPGQIKITDFGLAKLLDYNEEEYHAAGGKMPIKWLALECIQHRIFTHKSDVWSYGVTVWELFTYGQRPYETVRAKDVPDLLEKGERLPQPNICTIDVYMIMIKCWMLDADSRPSFIELSEEFAKMARDPGRYLVISGDELKKIAEDSNTPSQIDQISPDLSENPNVEGDKLMRLPSHSYDKNDLARSLSVAADGPEEVIEAEEYLQPTPRVSLEIPTTPVSSKTPLLQPYDAATNANDIHLKEIHGPPRREKRYAHLDAAAKARQKRVAMDPRTRGDSINSRYSSDPVKILHGDETDFGPVDQQKKPLRNGSLGQADRIKNYSKHQPDMSMKLPVDEDDYLQPKSTKPRAYADLLNDQDYMNDSSGSVFLDDPSPRNYREPAMNFENPEYFDETNLNVPKQQIANRNYYNDMSKINGNATELRPLVNADDFNSETTV